MCGHKLASSTICYKVANKNKHKKQKYNSWKKCGLGITSQFKQKRVINKALKIFIIKIWQAQKE